MQGYDLDRASKAKTAKDLGDSEPGGCEWGSVRATASEAVKGTVQRWLEVVETFQGLGAWHPDGGSWQEVWRGVSPRRPFIVF